VEVFIHIDLACCLAHPAASAGGRSASRADRLRWLQLRLYSDAETPATLKPKEKETLMDTRTRHSLKQDRFAQATKSSMDWMSGHRAGVMRWTISVAVVIVAGAIALGYSSWSSINADTALNAALDTYNAPLAQPGALAASGVYTTAADRAKATNQQFLDVARKYGWLPEGA